MASDTLTSYCALQHTKSVSASGLLPLLYSHPGGLYSQTITWFTSSLIQFSAQLWPLQRDFPRLPDQKRHSLFTFTKHLPLWHRVCCVLSCVWLSLARWTVARQALLSMEFSRQEYWSGSPFPTPDDLPNPAIEPASPAFVPPGKPLWHHTVLICDSIISFLLQENLSTMNSLWASARVSGTSEMLNKYLLNEWVREHSVPLYLNSFGRSDRDT